MSEYHKIKTVFERDPETNYKTLIHGKFARPEFEYLSRLKWEWTEKIDGTNIRITQENSKVRYDGKTDRASIPEHLLMRLQGLFEDNKLMTDLGDGVLYGEGFGKKIQKVGSSYIHNDVDFILFDVFMGGLWLKREDVYDIADKLDIRKVSVIHYGDLFEAVEFVNENRSSHIGSAPMEGLMLRPLVELTDRRGERIIAKIKRKDFGER